ncbi:MAG: alpha/beta hydrolase [Planctomycetota bacterium]|jgi:acetyl esterase/lipase
MRRFGLVFLLLLGGAAAAQDDPTFARQSDVIYGRKHGVALTMDIFRPRRAASGSAIVFVASGGWFSGKRMLWPAWYRRLVRRGHTVFAVMHGSQPKYTIPEMIADIHRAVRYIRHHAKTLGIDPNRIGIMGASAGGHLSLLLATDSKSGKGGDPVDGTSSRVQAVAAFYPPTDFLNWGAEGTDVTKLPVHKRFKAPFDFRRFDPETAVYVRITDPAERYKVLKETSPAQHVTPDDPPTLLIHGDRDFLVPLQQSRRMAKLLEKAGVEAKLIVKEGAAHGWRGVEKELDVIADWFVQRLAKKTPAPAGK